MAEAILSGVNLVREYSSERSPVRALDGVTIHIPRGTFASVMGPSGSGKSTLLHLLGGLERPSSGRVLLEGRNLQDLSERQLSEVRRNYFGFVFQFFSLIPVLTLEQNVALPAMISGIPQKEYGDWLTSLLTTVGLTERRKNLPLSLSGGEQQRTAIARALLLKPEVVLADEPTGNLDSRSGRTILELLKHVQAEQSLTVFMVTHDPYAASFSDLLFYLHDGSIIATLELSEVEGGEARRRSVYNWLEELEDPENSIRFNRSGS